MEYLLDSIILKDEFTINRSIDQITEKIRLDNNKKFKTDWIEHNHFRFDSNISFGTVRSKGFLNLVQPIHGFAELIKAGENRTIVKLKTKVRTELYFITFLMILMLLVNYLSGEEIPLWAYGLVLFGPFWFWLVYRIQEIFLFRRLKKFLSTD